MISPGIFSVAVLSASVLLASHAVKEFFSAVEYNQPAFLASHDLKELVVVLVLLVILKEWECLQGPA